MNNNRTNIFRSIQAQEKWRQKQIEIYYGSGRPLFKNWKEKVEYPIIPNKTILDNIHPYLRQSKNYK